MRYTASAMDYEGQRFFGGSRHWSQLSVVDTRGRTLWEVTLHAASETDWRNEGRITWASDSTSVVFEASQPDGSTTRIQSASLPAAPSVDEIVEDLEGMQTAPEPR